MGKKNSLKALIEEEEKSPARVPNKHTLKAIQKNKASKKQSANEEAKFSVEPVQEEEEEPPTPTGRGSKKRGRKLIKSDKYEKENTFKAPSP